MYDHIEASGIRLTTAARPHLIDFIGRWSCPGRPNLLLPGLGSVLGLDVLVPRLARVVEGLGEVSAHVSNINGGTTTAAHVHVVPSAAEAELDLPGFGKGWVRELRERVDGRGGALS